MTPILDDHITIIKYVLKSVLFSGGRPWVMKNNAGMIDVTMGSFDDAEICELVGLFILNNLREKCGKNNMGL